MNLRFRCLRRKHVRIMAKNPRSRPRHEVIDTKLYVSKKNSSFCDVYQVGVLEAKQCVGSC